MQGRSETPHRIPSLDGLRAISIALVLVLHMSGTRNFFSYGHIEWFNPGDLGVRTFFVISGFLITTLLLDELSLTGRISVKNFYIRRVFRIFPAFYAYIAVIGLLALVSVTDLTPRYLMWAATYTVNYHNTGGSWFISHLWSLSVEEQFYLLWPATLALLGARRGLWAAALTAIVVPVLRVCLWVFVPEYRVNIGHSFETVADALATGCLLAGTREWLAAQPWYQRLQASRLFILIPLTVVVGDMMFIRPRLYYLIVLPIVNVSIALTIDWCVRHADGVVGRILNSGPFVFVGVLSYSLYLWQQLYCQEFRNPNTWWGMFPVNLTLALVTAAASYYFIERPFLNLRKRVSRGRRAAQVAAGVEATP